MKWGLWFEPDLSGSWLVPCYNKLPHNPATIAASCSYKHALVVNDGVILSVTKYEIKYHPALEPWDTGMINSDKESSNVTVFTERIRHAL